MLENGELAVRHVPTAEQLADLFTKNLCVSKFEAMRDEIGMV